LTVESLYEQLYSPTEIAKQRFVEHFTGDVLDDRWAAENISGSPTIAMSDAINGGFEIIGTTAGDDELIDFNDIRQYDETACIVIVQMQLPTTSACRGRVGVKNTTADLTSSRQHVTFQLDPTSGGLAFLHASGGGSTSGNIKTVGTQFHDTVTCQLAMLASTIEGSIDGELLVTRSTNIPTVPMQPYARLIADTTATNTVRIKYFEVYNT